MNAALWAVVFSDVLVDEVTRGIRNSMWFSLKAAAHGPMTALGITTHSRTVVVVVKGETLVKMAARWGWQLGRFWVQQVWKRQVRGCEYGRSLTGDNGCTAAIFQLKSA